MKDLLIISGVSTGGKTYIAEVLPEILFDIAISHTTRPRRSHEFDALDYHFVNDESFSNTDFIETTNFAGYQYGLSKAESTKVGNRIMAHVCDWEGLNNMHQMFPDRCLRVFIDIDPVDIVRRMLARWMDNAFADLGYLAKRIHHALTVELSWCGDVDIYIANSEQFSTQLQHIIDVFNSDSVPHPIHLNRESPFMDLTISSIHEFLLGSQRPKRGESHKLLTQQLFELINSSRLLPV